MSDDLEDMDYIDDKYFGKDSTTADYAVGLTKLFSIVLEKLAEKGDRRTIARLCAFLFANFYEEIDMPKEHADDLKKVDPTIPLFNDPGKVGWEEFEKLSLLDKASSLKFLLDPVLLDIVRSEPNDGEIKLKAIGGVIYDFCLVAVDSLKEIRGERLKDITPNPEDLDSLWNE